MVPSYGYLHSYVKGSRATLLRRGTDSLHVEQELGKGSGSEGEQ